MRLWVVFMLLLSVLACRNDGEGVLKPTVLAKEKIAVEVKETNVTLRWAELKAERIRPSDDD